jgi:hypothetical protein
MTVTLIPIEGWSCGGDSDPPIVLAADSVSKEIPKLKAVKYRCLVIQALFVLGQYMYKVMRPVEKNPYSIDKREMAAGMTVLGSTAGMTFAII